MPSKMNENEVFLTSTRKRVAETRDKILRAITYSFSILILPTLFISIKDSIEKKFFVEAIVYTLVYVVWLIFGVFLIRKVTYQVRSTLILFIVFCLGGFILAQRGLSGGGILFLVTFCVMSTALIDLRFGMMAIVISLIAIVVIGMAMVDGLLPFDPGLVWNSTAAFSWATAGAAFFVLTICMVWTSGIFQTKLLKALSELENSQNKIISQNRALLYEIKKRKEVEQQKEEVEKYLSQTQKLESIGTLAGGIAHDFNNILSGIFGYSQLLNLHINEPERVKGYNHKIFEGAQRATSLIQQIQTFSRQTKFNKQPFNFFTILNEALKLIRSTIPTNIEIKEVLNSKAMILADATQIHQVIMNLCTNAYHAMGDDGGILTIELNEIKLTENQIPKGTNLVSGKYIRLEVGDTGPGIDHKVREKIFDPYFTTKKTGKGSGLGLAIVGGIVKKHNGFITFDTKIGVGTIFRLYFPITEGKKASSNEIEKTEGNPSTANENIMLVDDEPAIIDTLSVILSKQGYKISTFDNGESALAMLAENPTRFDLIVTDMTMPKMTGDKLSIEALKIRGDIPIIVCTGYHENFTETEAINAGIKKYIQKPVDGSELSKIIRELLDAI